MIPFPLFNFDFETPYVNKLIVGGNTGITLASVKLIDGDGNLLTNITYPGTNVRSVYSNSKGEYYSLAPFGSNKVVIYDENGAVKANITGSLSGGENTVYWFNDNLYMGQGSSVLKLTMTGSQVWSYAMPNTVTGIVVDSDYVYACSSNGSLVKLSSTGSLVWQQEWGNSLNGVDVDSSGNVYTVGNATSSITTRKWSATGSVIWSVNDASGQNPFASGVIVDDTYVYTCSSTGDTRRRNVSDGSVSWVASTNHGGVLRDITIDNSGNVYVCGDETFVGDIAIRKFNSSGSQVWTQTHESTMRSIHWG